MYIHALQYNKVKEKFVQSWGVLGKNWGINRIMAQVFTFNIPRGAFSRRDYGRAEYLSRKRQHECEIVNGLGYRY